MLGHKICPTVCDDHCSTFVFIAIFVIDNIVIEIRIIAQPLNPVNICVVQ